MKIFLDHGDLERIHIEVDEKVIKLAILKHIRDSYGRKELNNPPTAFELWDDGDTEYGETNIVAELTWDVLKINMEKRTVEEIDES